MWIKLNRLWRNKKLTNKAFSGKICLNLPTCWINFGLLEIPSNSSGESDNEPIYLHGLGTGSDIPLFSVMDGNWSTEKVSLAVFPVWDALTFPPSWKLHTKKETVRANSLGSWLARSVVKQSIWKWRYCSNEAFVTQSRKMITAMVPRKSWGKSGTRLQIIVCS